METIKIQQDTLKLDMKSVQDTTSVKIIYNFLTFYYNDSSIFSAKE